MCVAQRIHRRSGEVICLPRFTTFTAILAPLTRSWLLPNLLSLIHVEPRGSWRSPGAYAPEVGGRSCLTQFVIVLHLHLCVAWVLVRFCIVIDVIRCITYSTVNFYIRFR